LSGLPTNNEYNSRVVTKPKNVFVFTNPGCGSGRASNTQLYFLTSSKYFQSAAVPAGGILIFNLYKPLVLCMLFSTTKA